MPFRPIVPYPAYPLLGWFRFARAYTEMLQASAVVIPERLGRMAAAGSTPGARDRREFTRMVLEKPEAGIEAMQGMMLRMTTLGMQQGMRLAQQMAAANAALMTAWMNPAAFFSPQASQRWLRGMAGTGAAASARWVQAYPAILSRGVAPVRTRATANARRLVYRPAGRARRPGGRI